VGSFPADQDPHPYGPASVGEAGKQPGQLRDRGDRQAGVVDRAGLTGRVDRDRPRRTGQQGDRVFDLVGDGEPDRERHLQTLLVAEAAEVVQPLLGGAGAVAADQDRMPVPLLVGDLAERLVGDLDVVGGGVGAGVPRPQHAGQGFVGVVQPGQQRVIAEPVLERGRGLLLLRVAGHQAGVQVDHQTGHGGPSAGQRRDRSARLRAEQPGPFPRLRPGPFQRSQAGVVDRVQHPPRGRRRGDRPEQAGLVTQHRQIRDGLTAVGQQHREVGQDPTRRVHRPALTRVTGRAVQRLRQPDRRSHIGQQPGPHMRHHTGPVGADLHPRILRDTLHSTSAFLVSRN
jgi:hypothetical protein